MSVVVTICALVVVSEMWNGEKENDEREHWGKTRAGRYEIASS